MPSWSWQWMTYSECCLLIFYKSPKKWFIYILWQSRRSAVLWFPSLQKYNLSPIYLTMSQCPTFPTHSAHAPADTTTLVSSNQTNCPQTASYNLGTNLPKMSLQLSCHISMLCALCYNAPSLKSLLELISMNQIRKSEVWRIHGNKWWTWKDPYLMFEYKSNFNWCSIKKSPTECWLVDYLNIFILPRLSKIFDTLIICNIFFSVSVRSRFFKYPDSLGMS